MNANPRAALDALTSSSPLTLGKVAVLCRMDSPVLGGDVTDVAATLAALYVYERPLAETAGAAPSAIERAALLAYDGLDVAEYRERAGRMLDAAAAFLEMLPRPAPGAKKNSATDGAPSSPSGSAAPTDTHLDTSSGSCPPSRPRSCGGAGSRGRAETPPARC